jgi:hypothetical protein
VRKNKGDPGGDAGDSCDQDRKQNRPMGQRKPAFHRRSINMQRASIRFVEVRHQPTPPRRRDSILKSQSMLDARGRFKSRRPDYVAVASHSDWVEIVHLICELYRYCRARIALSIRASEFDPTF